MPEARLPVRRILMAALGIAGGIAAAIAVVVVVLRTHGLPLGGPAVTRPMPLEVSQGERSTLALTVPMLQAAPQPDLARYRADEARALDELAWVDPARTTARVPIRVAMAMMVARSASAAGSDPAPAPTSTSTPASPSKSESPSPSALPSASASASASALSSRTAESPR